MPINSNHEKLVIKYKSYQTNKYAIIKKQNHQAKAIYKYKKQTINHTDVGYWVYRHTIIKKQKLLSNGYRLKSVESLKWP